MAVKALWCLDFRQFVSEKELELELNKTIKSFGSGKEDSPLVDLVVQDENRTVE